MTTILQTQLTARKRSATSDEFRGEETSDEMVLLQHVLSPARTPVLCMIAHRDSQPDEFDGLWGDFRHKGTRSQTARLAGS